MKVTIVDYGIGNLLSVQRGFQNLNCKVELATNHDQIVRASHLVLPGVGAFGDGISEIRGRNLEPALLEFAQSGKPLLGICLGMQMLLEDSYEFGYHNGLGLIPGSVVEIPKQAPSGEKHKIPHIGWSAIQPKEVLWKGSFLKETAEHSPVYFVHSFMAAPPSGNVLAVCHYNGLPICAAVRNENVFGTQFHPEKSGPVGLKMLENFLSL